MAKSVFNTVYMINGHLVQLDEMLAKQAMANGESIPDPEPEPEPGSSLPPFTIRCKFSPGHRPTTGDSQVLVDDIHNVWDITKNSNNWDLIFYNAQDHSYLLEVLDANTSGVINMNHLFYICKNLRSVALFDTSSVYTMIGMFQGCKLLESIPKFDTRAVEDMGHMFASVDTLRCESLKTVPLLNTSSVTNMQDMFRNCTALTSIPLFDTSSVTKVLSMCEGCVNVEHGALALYQALSPRITDSDMYRWAFQDCGKNTITGQAELAQIPSEWK